jgi:hypothetical protein
MKIELLYFDTCPSYQTARALLDQVLAEERIIASVEMVQVHGDEDAVLNQFVGSPTLRVNGVDLFAEQASGVYAMQCRVYRTPEGLKGWPTKEMIRAALKGAQ